MSQSGLDFLGTEVMDPRKKIFNLDLIAELPDPDYSLISIKDCPQLFEPGVIPLIKAYLFFSEMVQGDVRAADYWYYSGYCGWAFDGWRALCYYLREIPEIPTFHAYDLKPTLGRRLKEKLRRVRRAVSKKMSKLRLDFSCGLRVPKGE